MIIYSIIAAALQGFGPADQATTDGLLSKAERAMEVSREMSTSALEAALTGYSVRDRRQLLSVRTNNPMFAGARTRAFSMSFNRVTGTLSTLSVTQENPAMKVTAENALSKPELRRRVQRVLDALGPFPAEPSIIDDDDETQAPWHYHARLAWKFHGLVLDEGPTPHVKLNRINGGLISFLSPAFPEWRPHLAIQGIAAEQARLRAQDIYFQSGALPYANVFDVGFVYGYPRVGSGSWVHWQTDDPQYSELQAAHKAILMYRVEIGWKIAYIDGRNGNPISVVGFDLGYGRVAGEDDKLKEQIESVAWRLRSEERSGRMKMLRFEKGTSEKGNVVLSSTKGNRIVCGRFDADAKTFTLSLPGGQLVLKPDEDLLAVLSKNAGR